ncbi:hypothetical protein [Plastoroseomonas hellenica]|uniref:hypothetical protein n=1 Tax=Plastoroseomonas hellenica TaxID=2687306 RepID=UPI001BADC2B8|nr:hypothetical protein [Plastoroseomonas hellenica]MBR0644012.1 hypothetical protein [Plastoroseomonas hellenica]
MSGFIIAVGVFCIVVAGVNLLRISGQPASGNLAEQRQDRWVAISVGLGLIAAGAAWRYLP